MWCFSFGKQLIEKQKLSPAQIKALFNIIQCRTAKLGGHKEKCNICGEQRYSYNSCGDRHCPKCQSNKQAIWVDKLLVQLFCGKTLSYYFYGTTLFKQYLFME